MPSALAFPSLKDLVLFIWCLGHHQTPVILWHQEMLQHELGSISTHSCCWLAGVSSTGKPWFAIAQFASRLQPSLLILARDSPGLFEE